MLIDADFKKHGFSDRELSEEGRGQSPVPTDYPKPITKYRLFVEGFNISIEEPYFWCLDYLRYMWGYADIDKITDIFSAAENSAFFGSSQQRLGVQQDKASQYLATIGKMVKELFQLVRELRVLDERMGYYHDSFTKSKSSESAEITLKGIWVDMVEQGAKNPASVYGMAREVQFTTLPDLFFSTHPFRQEDVDETVVRERGQFYRKVREVLKRKLRSFLAWKEHTFEELKNRRVFTLKYLRQHYEIIKMYIAWVKPYLRNIERLHMDQNKMDSADLLVAFETSMIEIEIISKRSAKKIKDRTMYEVILLHFLLRTRPEMNYTQEGYQRGPLHVGRIMMTFRSYVWSDKEVENYKRMKDREEMNLLGVIDGSVKAAMESLGDELMRYLQEAGDETVKDKQREEELKSRKPEGIFSPYTAIFRGFKDVFTASAKPPKKPGGNLSRDEQLELFLIKNKLQDGVRQSMWGIYHHFKKHHGMLNW